MSKIYQKLQEARVKFADMNIKPTGVNRHIEFTYYQLQDIGPAIDRIFFDLGITYKIEFTDTTATLTVMEPDDNNGANCITFSMPYVIPAPIISNKGKVVTNEIQNVGSTVTYCRRYLLMLMMNIVEQDVIDRDSGAPEDVKPTKNKPLSTSEKNEKIETITDIEGIAPLPMRRKLKKMLIELNQSETADEETLTWIAEVNKNIKTINKKDCEQAILKISNRMESQNENGDTETAPAV